MKTRGGGGDDPNADVWNPSPADLSVLDQVNKMRGCADLISSMPSEEHVCTVCSLYLSLRRLDLDPRHPNWLFNVSEAKMFDTLASHAISKYLTYRNRDLTSPSPAVSTPSSSSTSSFSPRSMDSDSQIYTPESRARAATHWFECARDPIVCSEVAVACPNCRRSLLIFPQDRKLLVAYSDTKKS